MSITLRKSWREVGTTYPEEFNSAFTTIESAFNALEQKVTGVTTGIDVSLGLQEIFDRRGIIGVDSYDFTEGYKSTSQLVVNAGAYWNGSAFFRKVSSTTISLSGLSTGTYYVNIGSDGIPVVQNTAGVSTTRQFVWTSGTKIVSDKALYSGVSILFDGDDYQDSRGAFDSLAERLQSLTDALDPFYGYYAQDLPHSGLNFKYKAGKVRNDSTITDTTAGQTALADNETNYIEVDPATGVVSDNTSGFTSGKVPLYIAVTVSGAITDVTDQRTAAMVSGTGGGGGHTQGTDLGTTATTFTIDTDATGSPTGRAGIEVENGDDDNAAVKYNRDTQKWEITIDGGVTWSPLLTTNLINQDVQEWSKMVLHPNPPTVHEESNRGESTDWEEVDVSSYLTEAPNGVHFLFLRVWFYDSGATGAESIVFRGPTGYALSLATNVWSALNDPAMILVPVDEDGNIAFMLTASGADTVNIKFVLAGYAAKVTGIGTLDRTYQATGLDVAADSTVDFNLTGWLNRGIVNYLKITETGGSLTGTYDIHFYGDDAFTNLLYKAEDISPAAAFEDFLPWWSRDDDSTRELHVRIINNDLTHAGEFQIDLRAEQFA